MRIFITGGTGFVGRHVIAELKSRGHEVAALVRRPGSVDGVEEITGDVTRKETLDGATLKDCDAAIHLVGIIRQFPKQRITFERLHVDATRHILWACHEAGIERYLHMSALGADVESKACYHRTKAQAEELVRTSQLQWTIFRPSMILGADGEFFRMVTGMIKRGIVPLIGDGSSPMAPLAVSTVAQAFANALERDVSIHKTYDFGGEVVSYRQMVEKIAAAMGRRALFIGSPVRLMQMIAARLDRFRWFPLSRGQINMLLESRPPADNRIYEDLDLEFKEIGEVIREVIST
jgi:NADH dehydrogenase